MPDHATINRTFLGAPITQRTSDDFLNATELRPILDDIRAKKGIGPFNLSSYLAGTHTKRLMKSLFKLEGVMPVERGRGRNSKTWVHPLVFLDIVEITLPEKDRTEPTPSWLLPTKAIIDNDDEDFVYMREAIRSQKSSTIELHKTILQAELQIKVACDVDDWAWASTRQEILRDRMRRAVGLVAKTASLTNRRLKNVILEVLDESLSSKF